MKRTLSALLAPPALALLLGGCGANYAPILDGQPDASYAMDLQGCQTLARNQRQFDDETRGAAALGAGVGAIAGLADDDVSDTEGVIAGLVGGAVVGGVAGMIDAGDKRKAVVIACMRGRGHRVVG